MSLFTLVAQELKIPGFTEKVTPVKGLLPDGSPFKDLGSLLSLSIDLTFTIAVFLGFYWFVWGAFEYIFAGGDKGKLGKARARMTWAIVGILILSVVFLVAQAVEEILKPRKSSPISFSLVQTVHAQGFNIADTYDFGEIDSLAEGTGLLITPVFSIAATAVVFYFLIAAFKIVASGGDKDALSQGRQMITHSIIGFILLMLMFIIFQFVPEFFGLRFSIIQ